MSAGTKIIALAFLFVAGAAAQQPLAPLVPLDSNAIMGFDSLGTWNVTGIPFRPGFTLASTTTRTQGSAAYSIANPPNLMQLTSQPIASTATALTGIGNAGALLQIDVLIPAKHNKVSPGWILAFVSSRSRRLHKVPLGFVSINNHRDSYRGGVYNTITFAIPHDVSSALHGATFSDLTFNLDVISLGIGTYLFDNLRVHSVPLVQSPTGTAPPPGYGGSVDLVVFGNAPVTQTFNLGPTQIPNGFHLKLGTVVATTVQLQLGLDGHPALTCTYGFDGTDSADRSYILNSCTGGFQAGDLVNANWVHMAIVGGDSTQKIRAQLALNPMGDLVGTGLIPPMPTFWGDADTCIPAPVPGTVVTTSASCSNQTAQANEIITNYFNQVNNANPDPNWIVPPVPEFALRHGDGTPNNNPNGPPPVPNDPPFDTGGDLNPGGSFDAYWRLNGNLTPTAVTGTDETKTHFDATFTTHGVLFGEDFDVVDVKVTADTDSGQTTPTPTAATSTGTLGLYVFGVELPSNGFTVNPSAGFSIDPKFSREFNAPPIQIWIFTITVGATVDAELKASGSAAASGLDLNVTPSASLGGHISGGIDLGIASGTVDARISLLTLSTPVRAQAKWVINTSPARCDFALDGSLKGDLNLSSGGGEVDLNATFGVCPFCYTDSERLFKWGPLASSTVNIFNDTIDVSLFELPASLCAFPITVSIVSPPSGASLSSGLPITLTGSANPNDSTLPVASTTYNWTYTPGANAGTASGPTTGANPIVTFGAPTSGSTSSWTIGLSATVTVNDSKNHPITSTASATSIPVTVNSLSSGVYISQVVSAVTGPGIPDPNGVLMVLSGQDGGVFDTGTITISGLVQGIGGPLSTTFTEAACTDVDVNFYTSACSAPGAATTLTTTDATTTSPSASWPLPHPSGTYKITMTTTAGGNTYTATVLVWIPVVFS